MTKPWKEFRQEIVRLYIQEGRTLQDVREIMQQHHGFVASVRSYRQHFDLWHVGKYNCKKRQRRNFPAAEAILVPPPKGPMSGLSSGRPRHEQPVPGFAGERYVHAARRYSDDHYRVCKREHSPPIRHHRLSLPSLVPPMGSSNHYHHPMHLAHYHRSAGAPSPGPASWGHSGAYIPHINATARDDEAHYSAQQHPPYCPRAGHAATDYSESTASSLEDMNWTVVPRSVALPFPESDTASVYDGRASDASSVSSQSMSPQFRSTVGPPGDLAATDSW